MPTGGLAASLGAMADSKDFEREWRETEKEDTVVAGAESEFGAGRLEFDDVAGAGGKAGDRWLRECASPFPRLS